MMYNKDGQRSISPNSTGFNLSGIKWSSIHGWINPIDVAPTKSINNVTIKDGIFSMLSMGNVRSLSLICVSASMLGNVKNAMTKKESCTPPTAKKGNVNPPIW